MANNHLIFGSLFDSCPDDWDVVPFQEAIDFQEGPGIMAIDFRDAGVPLIRLSGVQRSTASLSGCNFLDPEMVATRWNHFRLRRGDLLISTSATIGMVSEIGPETEGAVAYTGLIRLRPSSRRVCPGFIKYFASSSYFIQQAEGMAAGSVLRHFGPSHLRQMAFPIPPIAEQESIAATLGVLDDKIEVDRRMNATLDGMARALFQSWFVDFDPVHAKLQGRPPTGLDQATAALFPATFQDSALGAIPQGWDVTRLDKLASVTMGISPTGESYNSKGVGIPLINGPVEFGEYFPVKTKWTKVATRSAAEHDLIFCVRGSTTGRRVVSDGEYAIGRGVCSIRANGGLHGFLYQTINVGLDRLLEKTTGSVFPSLSGPDIKSFPVLMPSTAVLEAYERTAKPLIQRVQQNHQQSHTLAQLRNTLLPKLLSGQLRVPEAIQNIGQRL